MDEQDIGDIFPDDNDSGSNNEGNKGIENARNHDIIEGSDKDQDSHSGEDDEQDKKKKKVLKEKKKTKRKVEMFRFKPDMLTNQDRGIKCLYENLDKIKLFSQKDKGLFDEVKGLDKLMNYYKEWHFHFMPKYNFQYFLDKCAVFGKNNLIKTYMMNVRRIHKGEIDWKELIQVTEAEADTQAGGVVTDANDEVQQSSGDNNASKTVDTALIPKNIKDTYLPTQQKISKIHDLSGTKDYQSQDIELNNTVETVQQKSINKKKKQVQFEDEDENEQAKLDQYAEELKLIQEEIGLQDDNFYDDFNEFYNDDQNDIKLKRIQKED